MPISGEAKALIACTLILFASLVFLVMGYVIRYYDPPQPFFVYDLCDDHLKVWTEKDGWKPTDSLDMDKWANKKIQVPQVRLCNCKGE